MCQKERKKSLILKMGYKFTWASLGCTVPYIIKYSHCTPAVAGALGVVTVNVAGTVSVVLGVVSNKGVDA